jgi:archaellum component FlaC
MADGKENPVPPGVVTFEELERLELERVRELEEQIEKLKEIYEKGGE